MGGETTLESILRARDARAERQRELLQRGPALIYFTMNIAGPAKDSPAIRRAFEIGCQALEDALCRTDFPLLERGGCESAAGREGWYLLRADSAALKRLTVGIEESEPLGRLFDMDVLRSDGSHISRTELGFPERGCLVCGAPGKGCASRRLHPVSQIQDCTERLLREVCGLYAGLTPFDQ